MEGQSDMDKLGSILGTTPAQQVTYGTLLTLAVGLAASAVLMWLRRSARERAYRYEVRRTAEALFDQVQEGYTVEEVLATTHVFGGMDVVVQELEGMMLRADLSYAAKSARADEIAQQLLGTCKSMHDVATEDEEDDVELMRMVDQEVFLCSSCGWWCEACEANEAPHGDGDECDECHRDSEYDGDDHD